MWPMIQIQPSQLTFSGTQQTFEFLHNISFDLYFESVLSASLEVDFYFLENQYL